MVVLTWLKDKFLSENTLPSKEEANIIGISQELLQACLQASQSTDPNEFLCLLTGRKAQNVGFPNAEPNDVVLTEFNIIPGTSSNSTSAAMKQNKVPQTREIYGSLHSHPSGNRIPSDADLKMFQQYPINIIVGSPYAENDFSVYDNSGEPRTIEKLSVKHEQPEIIEL